ncbi:MAG: zinc ribbon domain-containing protein [Anaerolineales bacterium]|nr:zinc ribbon domain-containing protein [Anaerolineales bacterium]MCZ2288845.1 zinc ribbon domain-containing protein [Anaerolineales bacterium]
MEIGAIFLTLAVALIVGLYVSQPFIQPRGRRSAAEDHELSALMAERDHVVNALQDLDFDFALKKIPSEAYPAQRAELLKKGAEALKRLDALSLASANGSGEDAEERIESAVAARRADLSSAPAAPRSDDDVEALIAARRKARKEKSGGFCPRCGKPVLASDRFCPHCGKSIA